MKITKQELIELEACEDGLNRFIAQTGNTEEPVEVSSLVGGENTYPDLLWLAGKKLSKEPIVRFACDCALLNIELIKPYTDKYDMIVEFLRNPTGEAAEVTAHATHATHAARAARTAVRTAARAARTAAYLATDVLDSVYYVAYHAADSAYYVAYHAGDSAENHDKVNELLKGLFA